MKKTMTLWNSKVDNTLRTLVTTHGISSWPVIANSLNMEFPTNLKSPEECKERWEEIQSAALKKPWTELEELKLLIAYKRYRNKWSNVAGSINHRDNNSVKNRFYSIFRRIKNKIVKKDFSSESKLELPMIYFVVTLMEEHLEHPLSATEKLRKRGKDYIYSLLKQLEVKELRKYKLELQKLNLASLEDIYKEIEDQKGNDYSIIKEIKLVNNKHETISMIHMVSNDKESAYELPLPLNFDSAKSFTNEEKQIFAAQVFKKNEGDLTVALRYKSVELTSANLSPDFTMGTFKSQHQQVDLAKSMGLKEKNAFIKNK